jgi:arginine/ornithine transport system substrate-binding protein
MWKRWTSLLLVFGGLFVTAASAKDWDRIRVAIEGAYPPFNETNAAGELVGFDVDIANALCQELNAECVLMQQDWDGMIPGLLARKYDAIIASMSITEERKKRVNFTEKYYASPARFVAKRGEFTSAANALLKGKRVGVQGATVMDSYLTDNYRDLVEVRRYDTQEQATLDLTAGRIDLIFGEVFTMDEGFLQKPEGANYEFIGPTFSDQKWFGEGIGIAVRKQDGDLRDQLNAGIQAIRSNGAYDTIRKDYFAYDIYGD